MIASFFKQGPQGGNFEVLTNLINQELEARGVKPSRVISINTNINPATAKWSATVFYNPA